MPAELNVATSATTTAIGRSKLENHLAANCQARYTPAVKLA